jgi:hypothetical protein
MNQTRRRFLKYAVVTLALLMAAAWVLPYFLNAGRYRPLLKAGLERSLHRNVTLGHISLHFFPRLGFTIDNVVVDEDPAFGAEPFVGVGRLDCDLQWRSLWTARLYFGTLKLTNPSINLVRNSDGRWNIENLLLESGIKAQASGNAPAGPAPAHLAVEIEGARLNFKIGENKKPFAVVDTRAHLDFDYGSDRVVFRMAGDPVRTDIELPSPGLVELDGNWSPARTSGNTLDATLRMQGALLYDWIPLLTGRNPEVYGVMNSTIHLSGTLRQIKYSGESQLSQLHRWEQLPSSSDLPCNLRFWGQFDRDQENLKISGVDLAFADSQVHLEGSIAEITSNPEFDLVVAFERSQLQDLLRLGGRVLGKMPAWKLTGRLNGMTSIQGPWSGKRYGGFLNAHDVRLETASGSFPVSDVAVRIDHSAVRLLPARVLLAPGVEVVADGFLRHISPETGRRRLPVHPSYVLTISSHAVNLSSLVRFGRALGILRASPLEAEGVGAFTLHIAGGAWPWSTPSVTAQVGISSARLVVPGLREPLNIPRARVQVYDRQVMINPVVAVMGTSVFSGWVARQRGSQVPWDFSLKADKLSIEQASQWVTGTGDQSSPSFLDRLAGLSSLFGGRRPTFHLASHLDARGHFSTSLLTYRQLALHGFKANVGIHDRRITLANVVFEAGGGRGDGAAVIDLARAPVRFTGNAGIKRASIQSMVPYLPEVLQKAQGHFSASGTFQASGSTHAEIVRTWRGKATVELENIGVGAFDPLRILASHMGMNVVDMDSQSLFIPKATAHLLVQDRRVTLEKLPLEVDGAEFLLQGDYGFDGIASLRVQADLRGLRRSWASAHLGSMGSVPRVADLHFAGSLRGLEMVPTAQISQTQP